MWLSVGKKHARGLRELPQNRQVFHKQVRERSADRHPVARVPDRRREQIGPFETPEALVRLSPTIDRAWNGERRKRSARGNFGVVSPFSIELPCCALPRRTAGIEAWTPAVFATGDEPEPITAQARHVRIHDAEHGVGRDRGVNSAAAPAERIETRSAGENMRRRHHAARRVRRWAAGAGSVCVAHQ